MADGTGDGQKGRAPLAMREATNPAKPACRIAASPPSTRNSMPSSSIGATGTPRIRHAPYLFPCA